MEEMPKKFTGRHKQNNVWKKKPGEGENIPKWESTQNNGNKNSCD